MYFSIVLRELKKFDVGKFNAMLVKSKLEIFKEEGEEMDIVNIQGFWLYDFIIK